MADGTVVDNTFTTDILYTSLLAASDLIIVNNTVQAGLWWKNEDDVTLKELNEKADYIKA